MADPTYPQLQFPGAGSAPEVEAPDVDPIERASIETDTPPNVLRAIADDGGLDAAQTRQIAARLVVPLRQGRKMREALAEAMPGSSPEDVERIVGRALDIAGVERKPVGKLSRLAAGAQDTAAATLRGSGAILSDLGAEGAGGARRKEGKGTVGGVIANLPGDAVAAAPTIGASLAGAAAGAAVGSVVPGVGTIIGGLAGGIMASFPMLLDESLSTAKANGEDTADPGVRSRAYTAAGLKTALEQVAPVKIARRFGLMGPVERAAGNVFRRVAKEGGQDAIVEGVTEVGQMAVDALMLDPTLRSKLSEGEIGEIAPYIRDQYGEEALQNFLVGNVLGFGGGAVAGAANRGGHAEGAAEAAIPQKSAPESPITQVATPEPAPAAAAQPLSEPLNSAPAAAPAPQAAAPAPAPAPSGPLSAAVARGPQPVLNLPAGAPVTLQTPEGTFTGTLVGEDMHGARVSVEGEEGIISRQEIESGEVRILPAEVAPVDMGIPMSEESTTPQVDETPVQVADPAPEVADSAPPVVTTPEMVAEPAPAPTPGPVSEAAAPAAPAPRPEAPAAPQTAEQARQRLDFINEQGRTNGWNARLSKMRSEVEQTLADLEERDRQAKIAADVESVKRATDEQTRAAAAAEMQPDPLPNGAGEIQEPAPPAVQAGAEEAVAPQSIPATADAPAAELRGLRRRSAKVRRKQCQKSK